MSETAEAWEYGRCERCGRYSGPEVVCVRCDAALHGEDTEPVAIRLEGYRLGAPSYFCPACWGDRPEDFADAPGEGLTAQEAHGHVCDVCERALVGGEES